MQGYKIDFDSTPIQMTLPRELRFAQTEQQGLDDSLEDLLCQGVIRRCDSDNDHDCQFLSTVFVTKKRDDTYRVILNVKLLNEDVTHKHFKMDTLRDAIDLLRPGYYMASVDLKHAYFSVPISRDDRGYLCFTWQGVRHHFTCLPQGLKSSPYVFTKLLKPVYSSFRELGHSVIGYIDDSLLVGESQEELGDAVINLIKLFDRLGLTVHPGKSVIQPVQKIEFLGFELNSVDMTVSLVARKKLKIASMCGSLLQKSKITIRDVASVTGNLVAAEPGVTNAFLRIKRLEIARNDALAANAGNYDAVMTLSPAVRSDLQWWLDNVQDSYRPIVIGRPDHVFHSDASGTGWGGCYQTQRSGGQWSATEAKQHINWLELQAAFLTLKTFGRQLSACHVKLFMDNTTAVACVRNRGSTKLYLHELTMELFAWADERNIYLSAAHIPGVDNVVADAESRVRNMDTEWMLTKSVFARLNDLWGPFDVDLFASRINAQLPVYVSWRPDPHSCAVDAMTLNWSDYDIVYLFPPFSMLCRVLRKISEEQVTAVLIAPIWPTRPWWNSALEMVIDFPRRLPVQSLMLPQQPGLQHRLMPKLRLMALRLSGVPSASMAFRKRCLSSCSSRGALVHKRSMTSTLNAGTTFVVRGMSLPFYQI